MATGELGPVLGGCDDESFLFALYRNIRIPRNEAQRAFRDAWEAFELIHSDGFELLFEQSRSLEDYATAFERIGISEIQPIFSRVFALVPSELRLSQNEEAIFESLQSHFEELKALAYEFYDASAGFVPKAVGFVHEHRDEFAEFVVVNPPMPTDKSVRKRQLNDPVW